MALAKSRTREPGIDSGRLHLIRKDDHGQWCHEATEGSLACALRLTSSLADAWDGRLLRLPCGKRHGERTIQMLIPLRQRDRSGLLAHQNNTMQTTGIESPYTRKIVQLLLLDLRRNKVAARQSRILFRARVRVRVRVPSASAD